MIIRLWRALVLAIIAALLATPAAAQTDTLARSLATQAQANKGPAQRFAALYARFQASLAQAQRSNPHASPVMTTPPTVTVSTTEPPTRTPASASAAADYAPYVSVRGGWPSVTSGALAGLNASKAIGGTTGGTTAAAYGHAIRYETITDDPSPTIGIVASTNAGFRILVDDQYVSLTAITPPMIGAPVFVKLSFGSSATRKIAIEVGSGQNGASFTGSASGTTLTVGSVENGALAVGQAIYSQSTSALATIAALGTGTGGAGTYTLSSSVTLANTSGITASSSALGLVQLRYLYASSPAYTFWAPAAGPRMIVGGDSYTVGPLWSQVGNSNEGDGFARIAGDFLGIADSWASGLGGTGYIWRSSAGTFPALSEHLDDITAWSPDIVVIAMGVNDSASDGQTVNGVTISAATTGARAQATLASIRAALPYTPIIVLGPWRFPYSNASRMTDYESAIAGAVSALADPLTVFVPTIGGGWQTGSGDAGRPFSGSLIFTGALTGATSGTLATPFGGPTSAAYSIVFSDGTTRAATLTFGSTAVTWTGAVTATAAASYRNTASGNADLYISGTDKTHPTITGHAFLGRRVAQAIVTAMDTIKARYGL